MSELTRRVLIAEPNRAHQSILEEVLKPEENRWDLRFAGSAAEVLLEQAQAPADLLMTVQTLPDMSGMELLESMRKQAPEVIRFLLIEPQERETLRGLVSAAQQILVKPLNQNNFIIKVNRAFVLRALVEDPNILKLMGDPDALPALPRVFQELSRKLNDPNVSLNEIGDLIAEDIVLSSKVLKLANSALFSLRTPAANVQQAVSLLGGGSVSALVFGQSMNSTFKGSAADERFFEALNRHSIQCAALCRRILEKVEADPAMVEKSVFCGIAHDLGKLVLATYAPEAWREIVIESQLGEKPDFVLEREKIGVSHAELAAYLLNLWGFSTDQIIAICFHHEPSRIKESTFGLLGALHVAENCSTPKPQREHFDWEFLERCMISKETVGEFRRLHAENI